MDCDSMTVRTVTKHTKEALIIGLNAHNFILFMNSKDMSEEVKDTLEYTVLCEHFIKNLCGAVLQNGEDFVQKSKFKHLKQMYHCTKNYQMLFTIKNQPKFKTLNL